ncbi:hypothetical protein DFH06DRAFT_1119164 [Mycena polygramma]|nr:hypothetical protein DFH06DRAFT_1119164 [Mycena polygramma]
MYHMWTNIQYDHEAAEDLLYHWSNNGAECIGYRYLWVHRAGAGTRNEMERIREIRGRELRRVARQTGLQSGWNLSEINQDVEGQMADEPTWIPLNLFLLKSFLACFSRLSWISTVPRLNVSLGLILFRPSAVSYKVQLQLAKQVHKGAIPSHAATAGVPGVFGGIRVAKNEKDKKKEECSIIKASIPYALASRVLEWRSVTTSVNLRAPVYGKSVQLNIAINPIASRVLEWRRRASKAVGGESSSVTANGLEDLRIHFVSTIRYHARGPSKCQRGSSKDTWLKVNAEVKAYVQDPIRMYKACSGACKFRWIEVKASSMSRAANKRSGESGNKV